MTEQTANTTGAQVSQEATSTAPATDTAGAGQAQTAPAPHESILAKFEAKMEVLWTSIDAEAKTLYDEAKAELAKLF